MPRNAAAKQAVKNGRRKLRHGRKPWMSGKPVMKIGNGGTDKSAMRNNGRAPRYSNEPARR